MPNFLIVVMVICNISCQIAIITIVLISVYFIVVVNSSSWLPSKKLLLEEELCRTQNRRHKRDLFGISGKRESRIAIARQAHLGLGNEHLSNKRAAVTKKPHVAEKAAVSKYPVCYTFPRSKYPVCYTFPNSKFPICYTFPTSSSMVTSFSAEDRDDIFPLVTRDFSDEPSSSFIPSTNIFTTAEHTTVTPSRPESAISSTQITFSNAQPSTTEHSSTNIFPNGPSNIQSSTEYTTVLSSSTQSIPTTSFSTLSSTKSEATSFSVPPTTFPFRPSNPPTTEEYTKATLSSSNPSTVTDVSRTPSNFQTSTEYTSALSSSTEATLSSTQLPSIFQTTTNFIMGPSNPSTTEYTTILSSSTEPTFSSTQSTYSSTQSTYSSTLSTFSSTQYPSSTSTVTMPTTNPIMFGSTNLPHILTTEYITSPFSSSQSMQMSTSERSFTTDVEPTTQSPPLTMPIPLTNPILHRSTDNIWKPPFTTIPSTFSSDTDSNQYSATEMPFAFSSHIYTTESTPISSEYYKYSTTESPMTTYPAFKPTSNPIIFRTTDFALTDMYTSEPFVDLATEKPTTKKPTTQKPTTKKTTTKKPTTKKPTTELPTTTDNSVISRTPPPPSECPKHDTNTQADRCACFSDNKCRIDEHDHKCLADYEICQRFHPDPDKECIRTPTGEQAEVFYIYAGTPCPRNKLNQRRKRSINFLRRYRIGSLVSIPKEDGDHSQASSPHCKVEETLLAVNLGRDQKHVDGYGIQYMADNEVPWIDPNNTRKNDISLHLNGVDKKDMWLYRWQIWGDWTKKGIGHCVVYEVPLGKDGQHELNLKMIDNYWGRKGTRGFNVRFNGITILPEIDLIHTTQMQFRAVDMILNFEVTGHGKQLAMAGYPNSEIRDGFVELKFCYGECNSTDEDYHVAGFSVVRFAKPEEVSKDSSCYQFRRLPCLCKQNGCQYNMETGDCRKQEECPNRMFRHNECKRVNTFYSNGGVLCLNRRGGGSCIVAETIKAINFHGEATDDRRTGIMYESDRNIEIGRLIDFAPKCSEVNTKAKELYCFYTEAYLDTLTKEKCLEYNMPIEQDGSYEMSFKMGEFKFDNRGDRTFDIKLNGEVILKEFDILAVAEKNKAIDVNILFTVLGEGSIIWMNGYSLRRIDGNIKLQFCNGEWSKMDGSWILSAFSVVRFEYTFRNTSAYTFSA